MDEKYLNHIIKDARDFVNAEPGDVSYPGRKKNHHYLLGKNTPMPFYIKIFKKLTRKL